MDTFDFSVANLPWVHARAFTGELAARTAATRETAHGDTTLATIVEEAITTNDLLGTSRQINKLIVTYCAGPKDPTYSMIQCARSMLLLFQEGERHWENSTTATLLEAASVNARSAGITLEDQWDILADLAGVPTSSRPLWRSLSSDWNGTFDELAEAVTKLADTSAEVRVS